MKPRPASNSIGCGEVMSLKKIENRDAAKCNLLPVGVKRKPILVTKPEQLKVLLEPVEDSDC